jgi:hypothetical protein
MRSGPGVGRVHVQLVTPAPAAVSHRTEHGRTLRATVPMTSPCIWRGPMKKSNWTYLRGRKLGVGAWKPKAAALEMHQAEFL